MHLNYDFTEVEDNYSSLYLLMLKKWKPSSIMLADVSKSTNMDDLSFIE